jgi:glutaredoxin
VQRALLRALGAVLVGLLAVCAACQGAHDPAAEPGRAAGDALAGEPVDPPFAVRDGAEGLVLTWVDAGGAHTATSIAEVPGAHRDVVRVDSLSVPPERRLDPEHVYLADLRAAGEGGRYAVRVASRAAFDAYVDRAGGHAPEEAAATAGAPVVLYGASWCGACRQARSYFERHGIAFVDHDIEREPAARAEMLRKAQAAGVQTSGIPIIDFRGTILAGFSPSTLDRLIARGAPRGS